MAIVRTAGTEIIRTAMFEAVNETEQKLIVGEQHHIYTVLSIIVLCTATQAATNKIYFRLKGYDSKGGTTAQEHHIFRWTMVANETFVWNDKFSFNGHEPTDFAGPMDDVTKQNAIVDQGSSVAQFIACSATHASDNCDISITYIDQNNA